MDTSRARIHRSIALDDLPVLVDSDEVRDAHARKGPALRVDPECVGFDGISGGAVSCGRQRGLHQEHPEEVSVHETHRRSLADTGACSN
jgi:hypothetical protein